MFAGITFLVSMIGLMSLIFFVMWILHDGPIVAARQIRSFIDELGQAVKILFSKEE